MVLIQSGNKYGCDFLSVNENIRSLLHVLCIVNVTGFCLLSRNCDFSGSSLCSEKTVLLVIGGSFIKVYVLLTEYDTVVKV
jgi:hypothetical protein